MKVRAALLVVVFLAACRTVPVSPGDTSVPEVNLDLHGLQPPDDNIETTADCCMFRRTVPSLTPLTLVASAKDPESGVALLSIEVLAIRRCQDVDAFGTPSSTRLFEDRVTLASTGAAAGGAGQPETRLVNGTLRMADQEAGSCPRASVRDQFGGTHTVERTLLRFCGLRISARAQNGAGVAGSTHPFFLVPGPPGSGAFPCPDVPF